MAAAAAGLAIVGLAVLPPSSNDVADAATLAEDFASETVFDGLEQPTAMSFAPDGQVFVAEKSGFIKAFDSLSDTTPTVVADLRTEVHNYGDRGLLGLTVDPQFPTRPYIYPLYTYDALPGGTAPQWGTPDTSSDPCLAPPLDGCVVQGRLSQLPIDVSSMTATSENVLVEGWCQQYPSHSIGTVAFGADGMLYASGGEGASFSHIDWGQTGNPCADPPGPAGTNLNPPDAEGGSLRAQTPTRPDGEPRLLSGSLIRVDPDTGAGAAGNPFIDSADANAQRVIAYGMRNPFRFTPRPGTDEIWVGDVGASTWEEINKVPAAGDSTAENFGWPCFEGNDHMPGFDAADLNQCETLYADGGITPPYLQYQHSGDVLPDDGCTGGSSAISGVAFAGASEYPDELNGALFFADSVRGCVWAMEAGADGQPDPAKVTGISNGLSTPVQLMTGPDGTIYWVDLYGGKINRLVYTGGNHPPTAVATATPTSGELPLTVQFDGSGSTDPDQDDQLTYAWDLDGDGEYDDATGATASWTYTKQDPVTAGLQVSDGNGATATDTVALTPGVVNSPPEPVIDTPGDDLQWTVGQPIDFQGHATDEQDGDLPPSALDWELTLQHCPDGCHTHPMQSFPDTATGSFLGPDHEYPSHLTLTLTATDANGVSASTSIELNPKTVDLTFVSDPAGLQLGVFDKTGTTPFTRTVIVGSATSISAPGPQTVDGVTYDFAGWSDGGPATHTLIAPDVPTTYTATYTPAVDGSQPSSEPTQTALPMSPPNTPPPAAMPGSANLQPVAEERGLASTGVGGVLPLLGWGLALVAGGALLMFAPRRLRLRVGRHRPRS